MRRLHRPTAVIALAATSILTPAPASAAGWPDPAQNGADYSSCLQGPTGTTHVAYTSVQGINESAWTDISRNETNFSLVVTHNVQSETMYNWYATFAPLDTSCDGYRGGYFTPNVSRFNPKTTCTTDVTESTGASVGVLQLFYGLDELGTTDYLLLRLTMPAQLGSGPFTYTIDFTCGDDPPTDEPESGTPIQFDYRLPVLPAALPDTL
ncbi:MAG: hypothetical protein RLZ37_1041 [Actinomycetota bacterium]